MRASTGSANPGSANPVELFSVASPFLNHDITSPYHSLLHGKVRALHPKAVGILTEFAFVNSLILAGYAQRRNE
jgi:hypothetical protein